MKFLKKFLKDRSGVSPVIGVILMVAITVVMAAVVAGFVYGYIGSVGPSPNVAALLKDDHDVTLTSGSNDGRVAKLTIKSSPNIEESELVAVVTYTGEDDTEYTTTLDGGSWTAGTAVAMGTGYITLKWVDSDGSTDITAGDRLDFAEAGTSADKAEVTPNTDFTVKLMAKESNTTIVDQTVMVR